MAAISFSAPKVPANSSLLKPPVDMKEGAAGEHDGAAERLGHLGGERGVAEAEQGEAEGELQPAGDAGASLPGQAGRIGRGALGEVSP